MNLRFRKNKPGVFLLSALPALAVLTPIALALCTLSAGAWAQGTPTLPDAGQVLRGLMQSPVVPGPQALPLQHIDGVSSSTANEGARVRVASIVISGNHDLPTADLQALVVNMIGSEQSLGQLNAAARRITAYYRAHGFAVARAYLGAQDITNGTVTITIAEGRLASHKIKNTSRLSNERADAYFADVKDGEAIQSSRIDRSLLLLQDTPGVSSARATLQPGASVGTSALLIEIDPTKAYDGNVSLDNYGSRYTGETRVGGAFNLASPLQLGDQLNFTGVTTGKGLSFGRLAYQVPVGSDGLRLGAAYFDTRYQLSHEFGSLNAHGSVRSTSVFTTYPFIRQQFTNLNGTASIENKNLNDQVDATSTNTSKEVQVISLGLAGNRQDSLGGGGINSAELNLAVGSLSINTPSAEAIDEASSQSNGRYSRLTYTLARLQRVTEKTTLSVSVAGQQSSKNLDSSEKFALGGIYGVRAYPQGEGVGDSGYRGTLELRQTLMPDLQGTVFYDIGSVRINHTPFGEPASNYKTLSGAGFGLNARYQKVQLQAALAWRLDGVLPTTIPQDAAKNPVLWLQGSVPF